jgi:hypothetical protein
MISPELRGIRCIRRRRGLATAGLADDADRLALADGESDIVHGAHSLAGREQTAAHREVFCETFDMEQRLRLAADIFEWVEHLVGDFERICHIVSSGYPWRCACRRSAG